MKKIGIFVLFVTVLFSILCMTNRYIFFPDGEIFELYLLSRNLLILSIINWSFYFSIKLIFEHENKEV